MNIENLAVPLPEPAPKEKKSFLKTSKFWQVTLCLSVVVITIAWGCFNYFNNPIHPRWAEEPVGLVAGKISQSAPILVNIPDGVSLTKEQAKDAISFEPKLLGEWEQGQTKKQLIFKPKQQLALGKFYRITLASNNIVIQKDFQADEDPKVVAMFPAKDSEADESAQVTITFNRPMVPLTTLDVLDKKTVPVTIIPATDGIFKWMTTRTLKFVPKERLHRSSNYSIKLGSGLISMDGLPVPEAENTFTTRPLRYQGTSLHHEGITLYNEPVSLRFNQPVDLDKTKSLIKVEESAGKTNVPVIIEYGTRTVALGEGGKTVEYLDKSVLNVYAQKDRNNRPRFWDNNTNYQVTVSGAVPLEGDIKLDETRSVYVQVPDIIASVSASSSRSSLAAPDLFDPKGQLVVNFFEDINKDASNISAPGLTKVEYGQHCKLDASGQEVYVGDSCEKEDNKKQLLLSFDEKSLQVGQTVEVKFNKMVNSNGVQINAKTVSQNITVYPKLQIFSTTPSEGEQGVDLTKLIICTNSPLVDEDVDTFAQHFKANEGFGKWNWDPAYKVDSSQLAYSKCAVGQYLNQIRYGLRPEFNYQLDLNLEDPFGQIIEKKLSFTSGKISSVYTSFTNLQKAYNVTSPKQTKLTYAVENLDYVDLHICKISSQTAMQYLNYDTQPSETTPGQSLNCQAEWTQKINLPQKYWDLNYFQVDLKNLVPDPILGFYVLSFSNPQLKQQNYNYQTNQNEPGSPIYNRTLVNVTNLAAQEKKVEVEQDKAEPERAVERQVLNQSQGNLYWVSEIGSLNALSGAKVSVYQKNNKSYNFYSSGITDDSGIARVKPYSGEGAVIVSLGDDETLVSSQTDKFQWASSNIGGDKTYIYSDRPIYRPGQQVNIKGLYRIGYDASYQIFNQKPAHLQVFNSKNEPVQTEDLPISQMGTFSTVYNIPNDAPLGSYRVEALGGYYGFEVQDYVPSAFKLTANTDKEEYIAGDNLNLTLDANYYFGVPVDGGQVEYSIVAQDYYFDRYQDQYFQFGSGWYYSGDPYYGDNFILRDKATLDSKGRAVISQKLDFDKFFTEDKRKQSKVFDVKMTVTNGLGQSISTEKSFIVHRGEFYLGVNLEKNYFAKNEPNKLLVKSVDVKGKEKAVGNIAVVINKITWNYYKRQEVDGGYYYHSDKKTETVKNFTISTDSQGNYSQDLTIDQEGEYEVNLKATDGNNNTITSSQDFYVYGGGNVSIQPLNNESLDLAVENSKVDVGQNVKIIIKSPFQKAKALVSIERGRILDYQIVDITSNFYEYSFTVKKEYVPNFFVTVLLLSPNPQVKFGQSEFFVNTKEQTISVDVTPSKTNYLPGEEVTLDVLTKDASGQPVPAEVSLSVSDLSVLALVGNPKQDPVSFFYNGMPLSVSTASNIKNILVETDIPTGTKGGGGAEPEDLAKKKRGLFKDTAYWSQAVQTDDSGHAQVKFTLPDNLTTWQAEGLGITKDTKLGVGYKEFVANKKLMVVPLVPRFVIPGDEFVIGAQVFNQTGSGQKLDISFESPTLQILDSKQTTVNIDNGKSANVYFKVKAPVGKEDGNHTITVSAKNSEFEDTVDQSFPIKRNETYEAVATSNYTNSLSTQEYVWLPKNVVEDKGGVTVTANASLAGSLPDALNYLVDYPYGCTEQMVSKISAVAAIKRLSQIKNLNDKVKLPTQVTFDGQNYSVDDVVSIGLSRILANQTPEGGFTYYPNMKPDFYLSLDVLNALQDIKSAGYKVNADAEDRAAAYISQTYNSDINLNSGNDTLVLTAYTLANSSAGAPYFDGLKSRILNLATQSQYLNENISNLSLNYLALLAVKKLPANFQDQIFKQLENRVQSDARGAYLSSPEEDSLWYYYETPIKDTALFLKAITSAKRDYVDTDKLIRWLLASRFKDNSWGTTNNTVTALDAFIDYINWKQEGDSHFSLDLSLDGQSQGQKEFGGSTVFDTLEAFMPISSFSPEKLSKLQFSKTDLNKLPNGFYYTASLKYYLPVDQIAPRDEGFAVERNLYAMDDKTSSKPLLSAKVGEVLRGHLKIVVSKPRNFVSIQSPIPAGMELVNFKLATEDKSLLDSGSNPPVDDNGNPVPVAEKPLQLDRPGFFKRTGLWFKGLFGHDKTSQASSAVGELPDSAYSGKTIGNYILNPDSEEDHNDSLMLFNQQLQPGVYEYDYFVRALIPGKFQELPAIASELYTPENFGRTSGEYFEVKQ